MAYGPLPDQAFWQGQTGRTWTVNGAGLVLWGEPTLTLVGNNPQSQIQGEPYVEFGATAVDVNGDDLTSSIVIDSSAVNVDVPAEYPVTYDVTDSYGATAHAERAVRVLDVDRPEVRFVLSTLIAAGLPDGVQVYDFPTEQQKAPAVVIGTMDWVPRTMGSLETLHWTVAIKLLVQRSKPAYNIYTLETFSVKVAQLLTEAGMMVTGFETEDTIDVGGTPLLSGTLTVEYRRQQEEI